MDSNGLVMHSSIPISIPLSGALAWSRALTHYSSSKDELMYMRVRYKLALVMALAPSTKAFADGTPAADPVLP